MKLSRRWPLNKPTVKRGTINQRIRTKNHHGGLTSGLPNVVEHKQTAASKHCQHEGKATKPKTRTAIFVESGRVGTSHHSSSGLWLAHRKGGSACTNRSGGRLISGKRWHYEVVTRSIANLLAPTNRVGTSHHLKSGLWPSHQLRFACTNKASRNIAPP